MRTNFPPCGSPTAGRATARRRTRAADRRRKIQPRRLQLQHLEPRCLLAGDVIQILHPVADAFVQAGAHAGENHGIEPWLFVKQSGIAEGNREAYLKFDLRPLSIAATAVELRLYAVDVSAAGRLAQQLSVASYDAWQEVRLTHASRPAANLVPQPAFEISEGEWLSLDVTSAVQAAGQDNGVITFRIASAADPGDDERWTKYVSREGDPELQPQLIVHSSLPEESVAAADLAGYWNFNELWGSVASEAATPTGNDSATLSGDARFTSAGISGRSVSFDGFLDYVTIPGGTWMDPETVAESRTISFAYRLDPSVVSGGRGVLFEVGDADQGSNIYLSDGRLYVGHWDRPSESSSGEAEELFVSTPAPSDGGWHHVAVVLDATVADNGSGRLRALLDGVVFATGPAATGAPGGAAHLGAAIGGTRFHDGVFLGDGAWYAGSIDEFRVHQRALADDEVGRLAHQAFPPRMLNLYDPAIAAAGGLVRYEPSQEVGGHVEISAGGRQLTIRGNVRKAVPFAVDVSPWTILEFEVAVTREGDLHAIGLDDDLSWSPHRSFVIGGHQVRNSTANKTFFEPNSPALNDAPQAEQFRTVRIPIGEAFSGSMNYLTIVNDHDVAAPDAQITLRNVRVYEASRPANYDQPAVGDFDGDGNLEWVALDATSWRVRSSEGAVDWQGTLPIWTLPDGRSRGPLLTVVGDYNGDGRDDLASRTREVNTWKVRISGDQEFLEVADVWAAWGRAQSWEHYVAGDFNGDGRDDLARVDALNGNVEIAISSGTSFEVSIWDTWQTTAANLELRVLDIDGDNRDDLLAFDPPRGEWLVGRSNGTHLITTRTPAPWWTDIHQGDFDGDGQDELLGWDPHAANWHLAHWQADSLAVAPSGPALLPVIPHSDRSSKSSMSTTMDEKICSAMTIGPHGGRPPSR